MKNKKICMLVCALFIVSSLIPIASGLTITKKIVSGYDQRQDRVDDSIYLVPQTYYFQEFICQKKNFIELDLHMGCYFSGSGGVSISIEKPLGSKLSSVILQESSFPQGTSGWMNIDMPDITLEIGQKYYIVVYVQFPVSEYSWSGKYGDPYPPGTSSVAFDWDFAFRTIVDIAKTKEKPKNNLLTTSDYELEGSFIDVIQTDSGKYIGATSIINPRLLPNSEDFYAGSSTTLVKMDSNLNVEKYEFADIDGGGCTIPTSMEKLDNGNILTSGVFLPGSWGVFLPGSWGVFLPGSWGVFLPGGWNINDIFLPGDWGIKSFIVESDDNLNNVEINQIDLEGLVINGVFMPGDWGIVATGSFNGLPCLVRLDGDYNIVWSKTYTITGYDGGFGKSVVGTGDGGFAIACGVLVGGSDTCKPAVIKTDSNGNMEWVNDDFLPEGDGYATGVGVDGLDNIVVAGVNAEGTNYNGFICKIDENDVSNYNYISGGGFWNLNPTSDGGFALAGPKSGGGGVFAKFDSSLEEVFEKKPSSSMFNKLFNIRETNDGGFVLSGEIIMPGNEDADPTSMYVDYQGTPKYSNKLDEGNINLAPGKPTKPQGPTSPKIDIPVVYSTSATDPNGDDVYLVICECLPGKSTIVYLGLWSQPEPSGTEVDLLVKFYEEDTYDLRAFCYDYHGLAGEYSDPLPVTSPKNKPLFSQIMHIFEQNQNLLSLFRLIIKH